MRLDKDTSKASATISVPPPLSSVRYAKMEIEQHEVAPHRARASQPSNKQALTYPPTQRRSADNCIHGSHDGESGDEESDDDDDWDYSYSGASPTHPRVPSHPKVIVSGVSPSPSTSTSTSPAVTGATANGPKPEVLGVIRGAESYNEESSAGNLVRGTSAASGRAGSMVSSLEFARVGKVSKSSHFVDAQR